MKGPHFPLISDVIRPYFANTQVKSWLLTPSNPPPTELSTERFSLSWQHSRTVASAGGTTKLDTVNVVIPASVGEEFACSINFGPLAPHVDKTWEDKVLTRKFACNYGPTAQGCECLDVTHYSHGFVSMVVIQDDQFGQQSCFTWIFKKDADNNILFDNPVAKYASTEIAPCVFCDPVNRTCTCPTSMRRRWVLPVKQGPPLGSYSNWIECYSRRNKIEVDVLADLRGKGLELIRERVLCHRSVEKINAWDYVASTYLSQILPFAPDPNRDNCHPFLNTPKIVELSSDDDLLTNDDDTASPKLNVVTSRTSDTPADSDDNENQQQKQQEGQSQPPNHFVRSKSNASKPSNGFQFLLWDDPAPQTTPSQIMEDAAIAGDSSAIQDDANQPALQKSKSSKRSYGFPFFVWDSNPTVNSIHNINNSNNNMGLDSNPMQEDPNEPKLFKSRSSRRNSGLPSLMWNNPVETIQGSNGTNPMLDMNSNQDDPNQPSLYKSRSNNHSQRSNGFPFLLWDNPVLTSNINHTHDNNDDIQQASLFKSKSNGSRRSDDFPFPFMENPLYPANVNNTNAVFDYNCNPDDENQPTLSRSKTASRRSISFQYLLLENDVEFQQHVFQPDMGAAVNLRMEPSEIKERRRERECDNFIYSNNPYPANTSSPAFPGEFAQTNIGSLQGVPQSLPGHSSDPLHDNLYRPEKKSIPSFLQAGSYNAQPPVLMPPEHPSYNNINHNQTTTNSDSYKKRKRKNLDNDNNNDINNNNNENVVNDDDDEDEDDYDSQSNQHLQMRSSSPTAGDGTEELLQCHACPSIFSKSTNLKRHIKLVHTVEASKSKSIECKLCGGVFRRSKLYRAHMIEFHKKKNPYDCPHCDLSFVSMGNLNKHVRMIHEKQVKYICQVCDAKFFQKYNLERHMKNNHS